MKYLFLSVLFGLCVFTSTCIANTEPEQAIAIAETFATTIDSENYQAAYMSGSELLRLANDEQNWIDRTKRNQATLGKVHQRTLKSIRAVTSPADFPDGDYLWVSFSARAKHKAKAAEVILVEQRDGIWAVCSYSIR